MPRINLRQEHELTNPQAAERLRALMETFSRKYGFHARWRSDELATVSGRGVKGSIELQPGVVRFDVQLSLLLAPLRPKIEAGIRSQVRRALVEHVA